MDLPMSLYTFYPANWPRKDGTFISTTKNSRKLTKISRDYDDFIMKLLVTALVDDAPHLHNQPIVPIMINEECVMALIDTGAESTCINITKAIKFGLKRRADKDGFIKTISDKEETKSLGYEAKFNWVSNNWKFCPVDGFMNVFSAIPFPKGRNKYDVIIGRDILKKVEVTYNGKKKEVVVKWG